MPRRSRILSLPRPLRRRLDAMLIERGFSGYRELADWLGEEGHSVHSSSVQRYGAKLKKRTDKARAKADEVQAFFATVTQDLDLQEAGADNAGVPDDLQQAVAALRLHVADLEARVTRLEEGKA